jgi:hypothetical protein
MKDTPRWILDGFLRNGERIPWDEVKPEKGWLRWECASCGTVIWIKPFKNSKTAERVSF